MYDALSFGELEALTQMGWNRLETAHKNMRLAVNEMKSRPYKALDAADREVLFGEFEKALGYLMMLNDKMDAKKRLDKKNNAWS
jgi:hypothetical protein